MIPNWLMVSITLSSAVFLPAGAACAQTVSLGDVSVVYQPEPTGYQPQGSDIDLSDAGKSFDIACRIVAGGKLTSCAVQANEINDVNFLRVAVGNVSQWVLAPRTVDGRPVAGRTLIVTCQFRRTDVAGAEATALVSTK